MQTTTGFDLKIQLQEFERRVLSSPEVTPRDCQDLQVHLLDCMDEYKAKGIDEEEAFLLALNKVGDKSVWDDGFSEANSGLIQVKRALGLLGGVFFYFLLYSLLLLINKSLLFIGAKMNIDAATLYNFSKFYFQAIYLLTILGIMVLVMREGWFLKLLGKMNLTPRQVVLVFVLTIVIAVLESIITGSVKGIFKLEFRYFEKIDDTFIWFSYVYPLIFSGGFLVMYRKYFKESRKQ